MDERTDPSAAFALRLSADLVTALVVSGVMPKALATALIDDSLKAVLASHPEHVQALREIAATLTAQTEVASIRVDRMSREGD